MSRTCESFIEHMVIDDLIWIIFMTMTSFCKAIAEFQCQEHGICFESTAVVLCGQSQTQDHWILECHKLFSPKVFEPSLSESQLSIDIWIDS